MEQVETYSGARLHERPKRFLWQGNWLEVREIVASWQTPDYLSFKVKAEDGRTYLLRWHRQWDAWDLSREV